MDVPLLAWVAAVGAIVGALAVDLLVLHRHPHRVSLREAALTSAAWIAVGLGFGAVVLAVWGAGPAGQYLAGYLVEKSLSVDNIFVFAVLLSSFAVPAVYHHRVLFWGVVGALILRAGFIAGGAVFLETFHWAPYVFGVLLIVSAAKMARHQGGPGRPPRNRLLRRVARAGSAHGSPYGPAFFRRSGRRLVGTPLLAALVAVELTDVVFAIDSIPAVFAVTDEPFLVFTSNAFAILGLRALYFLLAGTLDRLAYLTAALSAVLAFIGLRMLASDALVVPIRASLAVIAAILGTGVIASVLRERRT